MTNTSVRIERAKAVSDHVRGGFFRSKRLIILISVLVFAAAIAAVIGTDIFLRNRELDVIQTEFLEQLQLTAGTYDESTIVLPATNEYEARKIANDLNAGLRMSGDGHFAVLSLREGTTVHDVCADDANKSILSRISVNRKARIAEAIDDEPLVRMPKRPDYDVEDDMYPYQGYLEYLMLGKTWETYKGEGVRIAVIDTGIDTDHPEFEGRISADSYNASLDKVVKDNENDWSLIEDENGHGTAVAGVLAAAMDGKGIVGIAPASELIVIKADVDEYGSILASDLVFGLYYAIECGANIVNMSFTADDLFGEAVRLAKDSNVLCVAATGNDGLNGEFYPAAYEDVIGVGALDDDSWEIAPYSNYGGCVDVVAPGTVMTTAMGGTYQMISGTSFSAPMVAGAMALLRNYVGPYMGVGELIERLEISAFDLGPIGKDTTYGSGALDIACLLQEPGKVLFNMMTDELDNVEDVYAVGRTLGSIPEPERLFAVFDGWYYDTDFTERLRPEDRITSDSLVVYAKWANEDDAIPFEYAFLEDGTVEIRRYTGKKRFVTIPDYIEKRQVSSIGDYAFAGQGNLKGIILPHYLKNIGESAFEGCTAFRELNLPDGVETIGKSAFAYNFPLKKLGLGKSLRTVGDRAFFRCASLTSIDLPATVETINGSAFAYCTGMLHIRADEGNPHFLSIDGVLLNDAKNLLVAYPAGRTGSYDIPQEVREIGEYAFCATALSAIDFASTEYIGDSAFEFASVRSVVFPPSVKSIGEGSFANSLCSFLDLGHTIQEIPKSAFYMCLSLQSVTIPRQITSIKESAFSLSSVRDVLFENDSRLSWIGETAFGQVPIVQIELPASLAYIGSGAFGGCYALRQVTFENGSVLQTVGDGAFEYTIGLNTISLPGTVREIGKYSFSHSGLRKSITLPAALHSIGSGAFAYCHSLTDIYVDSSNPFYKDVGGVVYSKDGTVLVSYPAGNQRYDYTIEDGTESIFDAAFEGSFEIEKVTFPQSVRLIGKYAFKECEWMRDYIFSEGLLEIGREAMRNNLKLREFRVPDSTTNIGPDAFGGDRMLRTVTFGEDSQMERIGDRTFACSGISEISIPKNVSSIGEQAFFECDYLEKVHFADNSKMAVLSPYLFSGCDSVRELRFGTGNALTTVEAHALDGVRYLERVDFSDAKITAFGSYAFARCPYLETVSIPDTLRTIDRFAFYRCEKLSSVTLPACIDHIGEYAFFGTKDLVLFFRADTLPLHLDEYWDNGLRGYQTGVLDVTEAGDWKYAALSDGTVSIIEYNGNDTEIDLNGFPYGDVSVIAGYAFAYKDIHTLSLPDSLTQIQQYAFAENKSLSSLTIPANVNLIGSHAFYYTGIGTLTFSGDALKVIEQYAFAYTKNLREVEIPGSLNALGKYVFFGSGIQALTFGDGFHLPEIPEAAFAETALRTVSIPASVRTVQHNAFSHNHNLEEIDLSRPENLMLMSNVFYNTGIKEAHIGKNVTFIGEYCFTDVPNLTSFEVDSENHSYSAIDGVLFNKKGTKLISAPTGRTGSYTISNNVGIIAFGAFEKSLISEIIFEDGSSLTNIGCRAFYGMKNLTSIRIPENVISINYYAFAECDHLVSVEFASDNRMTGVYEGAFFGCRSLESIVLPDTVAEIGDYAFYSCSSLHVLPAGRETGILLIGNYAFAYTGITDLTLPEEILEVGEYAFQGIRIHEFTFDPEDPSVAVFGIGTFADCDELESFTMPFTGQSLNSFYANNNYWFGFLFGADNDHVCPEHVPESLKNITITVQPVYNIKFWNGPDDIYRHFYKLKNVETVKLPDDTIYIGDETFMEFTSLKRFDMPSQLEEIDMRAFFACENLQEAVMGDEVVSIGVSAFARCNKLETVRLSEKLEYIHDSAFDGCAFPEIHIPETVTLIGNYAFSYCSNLEEIKLPEKVKADGEALFLGCDSLRKADMGESNVGWRAFYECPSIETVILSDRCSVIGEEAFCRCEKLKEINIPSGLVRIGEMAFNACKQLAKDIILQDGLKQIGDSAFSHSGITGVRIPGSVSEFGGSAFLWCRDLRWAIIENGVKTIPVSAFDGGDNLVRVQIGDSVETIGDGAFFSCGKLYDINLPTSLTYVGDGAFSWCGTVAEYTVPEGLNSLGNETLPNAWHIINNSSLNVADHVSWTVFSDQSGHHIGNYESHDEDAYGGHSDGFVEDGFVYFKRTFPGQSGDEILYGFEGYIGDSEHVVFPADYHGYKIDYYTFTAPRAKSIVIPEGFTNVELNFCTNVENAYLPIGLEQFSLRNCGDKLKEVIIAEGEEHLSYQNGMMILDGVVNYVAKGLSGDVVIPEGVTEIADGVFRLSPYTERITSVKFPSTLKRIGNSAFYQLRNLERVIFNGQLEEIEQSAFLGCEKLNHLSLNSKNIGEEAFVYCLSLSDVTFEEGIESIGTRAFSECYDLAAVVLPASLKSLGESVFSHTGSLTINSGNPYFLMEDGILYSLDDYSAKWYSSSVDDLVIPAGATEIGKSAFTDTPIKTVVIPEGVVSIDEWAFYGCANLETIVLPQSLESIGDYAFGSCVNLRSVVLPRSLRSIGGHAFDSCRSITAIDLPSSLDHLGYDAFSGTSIEQLSIPASLTNIERQLGTINKLSSISVDPGNEHYFVQDGILYSRVPEMLMVPGVLTGEVTVPDGVETIGFGAFWEREITAIHLPDSLKTIGNYAFAHTSLVSISFPDSVCEIGVDVFQGCADLETVHLPKSLTTIAGMFSMCSSLKEIYIPENVNYISNLFTWCDRLEKIVVDPANAYFSSVGGVLYNKDHTRLIAIPDHLTGELIIPEGIIMFDRRCPVTVSAVSLPSTLTYIAEEAFRDCDLLTDIRFSEGLKEIRANAFTGCLGLHDLSFPKNLLSIHQEAFSNCRNVLTVSFGPGLEYIGPQAFSACITIKTAKFEEGCSPVIEDGAFDCGKLIYIENDGDLDLTPESWDHGGVAFAALIIRQRGTDIERQEGGWRYHKSGDWIYSVYEEDDPWEDYQYTRLRAYLGNETSITLPEEFAGKPAEPYMFDTMFTTEITIPDGTRSIPQYSFYDNRIVTAIRIPDSVKSIGGWAFYGCYNLTEINLPERLMEISNSLFQGCWSLESIDIPYGIYTIGGDAFRESGLKSVVIPDTVREIGGNAFLECNGLSSVDLPEHLEIIGDAAFAGTALTSIKVPRLVRVIGNYAFVFCPLEEIELPEEQLFIGADAFVDTTYYPGPESQNPFYKNPDNWDGDFLFCGRHLLRYVGNEEYVRVRDDTLSICASAFAGNYKTKYLEIGGNAVGALAPRYLPSLEILIITKEPDFPIFSYFAVDPLPTTEEECDYALIDVPDTLRAIVLKPECHIEHMNEFQYISEMKIFVESPKEDAPWDRIAPGWNNDNPVWYGDKWYWAEFYDQNGKMLSMDCFLNSAVIRPPHIVLPKSGEIAYTHVGWDLDGDGKPDGIPASRLSDVKMYAIVETSSPAEYTVRFMDLDRRTVLEETKLTYGSEIKLPEHIPEKRGYAFIGWENFTEGMTIETDTKIYSIWEHDGGGHMYTTTVIPPKCTEKGYTKHVCSICGDEYKTDYVDELWHKFGEWTREKEPGCVECGEQHRVCSVCGFVEEMVILPVGHSFTDTVGREPSCTEYGLIDHICTICGAKTQSAVSKLPHEFRQVFADREFIEWLDKQFSGIVWGCQNGQYWYYLCEHCGKVDVIGAARLASVGDTEHGHEYAVIAGAQNHPVAIRCQICGETHCHEHDYEMYEESNGEKKYRCRNCGDEYKEVQEYTVTFLDWDDSVISQSKYHYGDTVVVPQNPTRPSDSQHHYTFAGWDKEITPCYGDVTYKATYSTEENLFTITFKNEDGSVIAVQVYHYGDTVTPPSDPVKQADNVYTYAFAGWTPSIVNVTCDATFTATYNATYIDYVVRFVDYDNSLISEKTYHYGDTVSVPQNPTRSSDSQHHYTFAGWDKEITPCYGDTIYKATYSTEENLFTITFKNEDGSVIAVQVYHYGDTVTPPSDPVKQADNVYTYAFAGWTPSIASVAGDATYTATYNATYIDYVVRFVNYDDSLISEKTYHYGDTVTVPKNPERTSDQTYRYVFTGWTPEIKLVGGDATYTAAYRSEYVDYTVKFIDWDGKILSEKTYHYNDAVTAPENPVRAADDKHAYEFKGWSPAIAPVTANAEYQAEYTEKAKTPAYKLGDVNGDGRVNAADYLLLKRIILRTAQPTADQSKRLDINRDGTVRANDYMLLKRIVLGTVAKT